MTVQRLERTRSTFMDKISKKDPSTIAGYEQAINNFESFCAERHGKIDMIADLKEYHEDDVFLFLQSWINWNSTRSPRTIKNYFSRVKNYIHYRGIKLHPQDVKIELEFPTIPDDELYGLKLSDIQLIIGTLQYKHRVQFICQLSSLMRIGESVQLRKKHLIISGDNIIVKIPSSIAKFKKARTTFFSKEASRLLRPLLRKINDNDLVFGSCENKRFAELNSEQILRRTLVRVGLNKKYENGRYQINTHSLRAYGITKISRHDPNFAKKLAGQKGYLLQYDRMDDEEKLELYQKYEIDLIIDDTEKQKAEIKKLEKEKTELQEKSNRISELENKFVKLALKHDDYQDMMEKNQATNFRR